MIFYIKYIVFLLILISLFSCSTRDETKKREILIIDKVLPTELYEGEEVFIYAMEDSVRLKSDSLFFGFRFYMQDLSSISGYLIIEDRKAKLTIPKNAALLTGYFYSLNDKEERKYVRRVYDKTTSKEVLNAYQLHMDEEMMNKELENHPNNSGAYVTYIEHLHEKKYLGQISDTLYEQQVKKYLSIVEKKANIENVSDVYALISLYSSNQEYEKAESLLLDMVKKHPNENLLHEAYNLYFIRSYLYREDKEKMEIFMDSLDTYIAKNLPHTPIGIKNSIVPLKRKYYTLDIIAKNAQYQLKNIDSTNYSTREIYIRAKMKLSTKDLSEAKCEALKILEEAKTEKWKIYNPMKSGKRNGFAQTGSEIGFAYYLLAEVSQAEKDYNQAIKYLDSAYMSYQTDRQNNFINNPITEALNLKASIQKKINQQDEVLKTYETLYQETKDDRVLDSIKVLFKETEQEKGFESYAKNLKEKVENKNQEPKKLAADFSIKDMSGYEIKLSEWKGRVVVLNFWANYCLPCVKEIPLLNQLWRETQTKDIIFLSVTKNTPLEVTRFAQRQKEMFSFSILPNAKELCQAYNVNLVPTQIVINKKGEIVHRKTGFGGNIDKLKQVVLEELNK